MKNEKLSRRTKCKRGINVSGQFSCKCQTKNIDQEIKKKIKSGK